MRKINSLRRGFTLVELLVVISILALLAGMLMPAIAGAMATARKQNCANNIGQIQKSIVDWQMNNAKIYPMTPDVWTADATCLDTGVLTDSLFCQLALDQQLNPKLFNSPAGGGVTTVMADAELDTTAEAVIWSGGATDAAPYAFDWGCPKTVKASTVRMLCGTNQTIYPDMYGKEKVVVAFFDGHVADLEIMGTGGHVYNDLLATMTYDAAGVATKVGTTGVINNVYTGAISGTVPTLAKPNEAWGIGRGDKKSSWLHASK